MPIEKLPVVTTCLEGVIESAKLMKMVKEE